MDSVSQTLNANGLNAGVYTASDIVVMRASNMGDMNSTTQMLLQLLGPACAVVAGIVIATTFSTLLARQARQTGLGITWLSIWAQVVIYTALGAVLMMLGVLAELPLIVVGGARLVEWLGGGSRRPVLQLAARAEAADGVERTVVVPVLDVGITPSADEVDEIAVSAVDPVEVASVVRSDKGLEGLDDDTFVLANDYGLAEGTAVTLTGTGGSRKLTVHLAEAGIGQVVTPDVAAELSGGEATDASVWVRTAGDGTGTSVVDALQRPDLVVSTSATERVHFNNEVSRIVTIIVAVLAFTLLITLSGLANTTDVSVLERFREIGVLRATGVQRGQVRRLFITEAVLTSLLGGLLGAIMGTVFGMAAVVAVFGLDAADSLVLQVPWLGLVGILLAAAAIGVLAALRPAGRAAAVAPVSALAQE